ncbi:hypothetical protein C6N75_15270 [Streptomyces solincola]|uniref:Uncharacterized protein n=1 Tax=Streptomyces solincola TaxID=2100817 RepID=A0A2S9PVC1_9ACTN|nr:hypothetical protein [Streptomyces solincola]PRH78372.1 hypothetical protein C6N75_15270 [Streptomyces solincola]
MCVTDVTFYPLIVADRPDNGVYEMPPAGTDMSQLRIIPNLEVRPGDLVLGAYDGAPDPARLRWAMQSCAAFPALPVSTGGYTALEGESLVWPSNGVALVIPREHVPAGVYGRHTAEYRPGDRVVRSFIHMPEDSDHRHGTEPRAVIQRGTVTAVEDDALTIAWAGRWPVVTDPVMRLAAPDEIERERGVYGFAVGDTVQSHYGAAGVVLELWLHWYSGAPMAFVHWDGDRRTAQMTFGLSHDVPAAA